MSAEQLPSLSVIDPISPAIERVKITLFKPFDLAKWFTIGFCAWLAQLGQGRFSFNYRFPSGNSNSPAAHAQEIQNFLTNNIAFIVIFGLTALVIGFAIFVTLLWLNSRGKFMFIHCIAQNKAEVKVPWRRFKQHGNNLFVFRLVASIISFLASLLLIAAIAIPFIILKRTGSHAIGPIVLILIFIFLIMIPVMIAFGLFFKFTKDFAVPIMYLRSCTCINAWRELLGILSAKKGAFALYILFQIVIAMAIGSIVLVAMLLTCCCAACVMAIPYLGTVLRLPLLIFQRSYSLCYLAQLGPEYNVFPVETAEKTETAESADNSEAAGPADNTEV